MSVVSEVKARIARRRANAEEDDARRRGVRSRREQDEA
jgi:hypothetical protein